MTKRAQLAHQSWLPEANVPTTDFPLAHLPYGVFDDGGERRVCVAIGAHLLDLRAVCDLLPASLAEACRSTSLNALMSLGPRAWGLLRRKVAGLLHVSAELSLRERVEAALHSIAGARLLKPVEIPNYTDFYSSIHHAMRVGQLFRPDQPLLPNYNYVPIGYHGRASSIVVSGAEIHRPCGQVRPAYAEARPEFRSTESLDYELELGFYVGQGNAMGDSIAIADAGRHLFGMSLVNDWSARDVQAWEYQPLGPFLGKSFATSVSPWVTPMAALEPFRAPTVSRPDGDPQPLPYLHSTADRARGGLDVRLEVLLSSRTMRANGLPPRRLSESNASDLYWSPAQMVTHHTSNGCNLKVGDLLATGTISGAEEDSAGCLLELTRNGGEPVALPTGETRGFLADGDEVIFRGYCEAAGQPRIGLGECRGKIVAANVVRGKLVK